jgi:hypothetical protein
MRGVKLREERKLRKFLIGGVSQVEEFKSRTCIMTTIAHVSTP